VNCYKIINGQICYYPSREAVEQAERAVADEPKKEKRNSKKTKR